MNIQAVISIHNDKNGKDKTLKLIQYFAKLVLHNGYKNQNLSKLASSLSLFRAIMRMGNWVECGHNIIMGKVTGQDLVVEILDFYTAVFDDFICAKKMGILANKRISRFADKQAANAWFLAIMFNIRNAYLKYKKSPTTMNAVSFWKLFCDGVFCAVDVFELDQDLLQILSGFASGALAYYKLYAAYT